MDIAEIAALAPVIPVLTVEGPADGVPLARALVKGGLRAVEVTLRTEGALAALRAMAAEVPEVVLGAGTILAPAHLDAALKAGAQFIVSPGRTAALGHAAKTAQIPFLPGIQTVSEAMAMSDLGFRILKFFPAQAAGGIAWLKSAAAPLAGLRFCPTGGVGPDNVRSYLELGNVACVGGSWVAPREAVAAGNWPEIERLAAAAAALKRP